MLRLSALALALAGSLTGPASAQAQAPPELGWVLPGAFDSATERAATERRMLLVIGISYGIDEVGARDPNGGKWSPNGERLRAGALADPSVRALIARRFVPFYYNVSGLGAGDDRKARKFVGEKTESPFGFVAAFAPEGAHLGEIQQTASRSEVHAWLLELLDANPEFSAFTEEEEALLAQLDGPAVDSMSRLTAARLASALGDDGAAWAAFGELREDAHADVARSAMMAQLQLARRRGDWKSHAEIESGIPKQMREEVGAALAIEIGYRMIALGEYMEARDLLQPACAAYAADPLHAPELHILAGRACWFEGDRDWGKFHFCFTVENFPDHPLRRRAYIAAGAEGLPFKNPDLGGYTGVEADRVSTHDLVVAYHHAKLVHDTLLPDFEAALYRSPGPSERDENTPEIEDPTPIVRAFKDGNAEKFENSRRESQLLDIGMLALDPLVAAVEDEDFEGRGSAAACLAKLLASNGVRPADAMDALEEASKSRNGWVKTYARSGLRQLKMTKLKDDDIPQEEIVKRSPILLVAQLADGEEHTLDNDAIIRRLQKMGQRSVAPLVASLDDKRFPGRASAATALGRVLSVLGMNAPPEARAALEALRDDPDKLVASMADAALKDLDAAPADEND